MKAIYSLYAYILGCLFLAVASFWFYPKWQKEKTEATLSWDVSGYYLYLPAAFIYDDLKQVAFLEEVIEKYRQVPDSNQSLFEYHNGNRIMKYSMGQAVLYSPFFFVAHLYALNSSYPADGYSAPYQLGIQLGSLLIAFLGLFVMRRNLLHYFSLREGGDKAIAIALLLLVTTTNYLEYGAITNAMTHNYLFTIYALLIALSIRFYEKPNWWCAAGIGILVGLAALTRPTDIIAALIPLGWGISTVKGIGERISWIIDHWAKYLLAVLVCLFIGSWQLIYWKYVSGEWVVYSYQDQGFSWWNPHFSDGLFSYRAGWLVYTPMMILALIGFIPLIRNRFPSAGVSVLFLLVFSYITFAWNIWWYGGSLGQRVMVQAYPILLFPFTAFFLWLFKLKGYWKVAVALFCGLCLYFNLWLHYQAHGGGLYRAGFMTKAYFLRVVGRLEKKEEDLKLLDAKEDFRGKRKNVQLIYSENFESDSLALNCPYPIPEGKGAAWVDKNRERVLISGIPLDKYKPGSWIRTRATFYCPGKVWNFWVMPQFIVELKNGEKKVKKQFIRPYRMMGTNETKVIYFDHSLPTKSEVNNIEIEFWRAYGNNIMVIDNLEIELFEEE